MQIVYGKGKKSKSRFMSCGYILQSDVDIPLFKKSWIDGDILDFGKRETTTLKTILRKIKQQNYEKGTVIRILNWYVGYAELYVIVQKEKIYASSIRKGKEV